MNKTYSLYKHTTPDGKVYIGITSQRPTARWQRDGLGYKAAGRFREAIAEFGWTNIQHDIVATYGSAVEAYNAEQALIAQLDSRNPDKGYNVQIGGRTGLGASHTEETKAKLREAKLGAKNPMFGKHLSEEHRTRISYANTGRKKSEETVAKMRIAQGNRSEETRRKLSDSQEKKPVRCIETGEVFAGVAIAARAMNLSDSNISACCKGRRKSTGGFHWCYVESHANTEVTTDSKVSVAP